MGLRRTAKSCLASLVWPTCAVHTSSTRDLVDLARRRETIAGVAITATELAPISIAPGIVAKPFPTDPGFSASWWDGVAKGRVSFYSISGEGYAELARAQVKLGSDYGIAYPAWSRPSGGASEIELFEVRVDLRRTGLGTAATSALLRALSAPVIASSLNAETDRFWRSLGWEEYAHPEADEYHPEGPKPAVLFVRPD